MDCQWCILQCDYILGIPYDIIIIIPLPNMVYIGILAHPFGNPNFKSRTIDQLFWMVIWNVVNYNYWMVCWGNAGGIIIPPASPQPHSLCHIQPWWMSIFNPWWMSMSNPWWMSIFNPWWMSISNPWWMSMSNPWWMSISNPWWMSISNPWWMSIPTHDGCPYPTHDGCPYPTHDGCPCPTLLFHLFSWLNLYFFEIISIMPWTWLGIIMNSCNVVLG